jgi:hypothetical protein
MMLEVNGHRILVGIDTSGSMDERDTPGRKTRYQYVREKVVTFVGAAVQAAYGNEVGLLFFSEDVDTVLVKSASDADVAFGVHHTGGSTSTDQAINTAWALANKTPNIPTMLFVVTDGHPNGGGGEAQGQKLVDQAIIGITQRLQNPEQFRIMILTVGKRDAALDAWLEHLDADLGPAGAKFDIVGQNDLMLVDFAEAATELIKSTTTDDEAEHGETQGKATHHT